MAKAREAILDLMSTARDDAKCHACGCYHDALDGLAALPPGAASARRPREIDCRGCDSCPPGEALALAGQAQACCGGEPARDWPPLPGDYRVLDPAGRIALCTLASGPLMLELAARRPRDVAIVGTLCTENLGIERLVLNLISSATVDTLVLCGPEEEGAVGHLAGRSLLSLFAQGVEAGRIAGAPGRRPELRNLTAAEIERFRAELRPVDRIGETDADAILALCEELHAAESRRAGAASIREPEAIGKAPGAPRLDPAGYFVIDIDPARRRLLLEHYDNDGRLSARLAGESAELLCAEAIRRGLCSRLDHAAYLGAQLARAELALREGRSFVQDAAPPAAEPPA